MMFITHAILGYLMGVILRNPWLFLLGSVLPDIDLALQFIFPEIHRTLTHSITFAVAVPFILWIWKRNTVKSIMLGSGILFHLMLDFFTFQDYPFFWPIDFGYTLNWVYAKNIYPNIALWILYGTVALLWARFSDKITWKYKKHAVVTFLLLSTILIVWIFHKTSTEYLVAFL